MVLCFVTVIFTFPGHIYGKYSGDHMINLVPCQVTFYYMGNIECYPNPTNLEQSANHVYDSLDVSLMIIFDVP